MIKIATIEWFGWRGTSVFSENTVILYEDMMKSFLKI